MTPATAGRPVVIGQVPGGEAGVVVGDHLGHSRVDWAVTAGDLPLGTIPEGQAVEQPADAQVGGELIGAFGWQHGGTRSCTWASEVSGNSIVCRFDIYGILSIALRKSVPSLYDVEALAGFLTQTRLKPRLLCTNLGTDLRNAVPRSI